MPEAYIVESVRSAIGKRNGTLSHLRSDELAAQMLKTLVNKANIDPMEIEDVIMGCVTPVGEQGLNIGRIAALNAGFPIEVTGVSINRMCGSSQQAVNFAAMAVLSGHMDMVIASGVESMSRVSMGSDAIYNGEVALPSHLMTDRFAIIPQGNSAELIAEKWDISREDMDAYSLSSHQKAIHAIDNGFFKREIIPIRVLLPSNEEISFEEDEGPRKDTSKERLAKLKPAFAENGRITAGSSSQISDGTAGIIIANDNKVKSLNLTPRARIVSTATAGVDPTLMLTGPIPAIKKVLAKAGLQMEDIDLFEINEAFASVVLATAKTLDIDLEKINVCGGAIALGHPLGASGARLVTTALHELERRRGKYALISMCIGFGQGIATIIERL